MRKTSWGGFLHPWLHSGYSLPGQDSRGDLPALRVTPCDFAALGNGPKALTNHPQVPLPPPPCAGGGFQTAMKAAFAPKYLCAMGDGGCSQGHPVGQAPCKDMCGVHVAMLPCLHRVSHAHKCAPVPLPIPLHGHFLHVAFY